MALQRHRCGIIQNDQRLAVSSCGSVAAPLLYREVQEPKWRSKFFEESDHPVAPQSSGTRFFIILAIARVTSSFISEACNQLAWAICTTQHSSNKEDGKAVENRSLCKPVRLASVGLKENSTDFSHMRHER